MNLAASHDFARTLLLALVFGRVDLALEFSAMAMIGVALDAEDAGLRYGPRMPS